MYSFNITILGEGHPLSPGWQGPGRYFNPPSPCGEGPGGQRLRRVQRHFNPPSPCGEGRHRKRYDLQHHSISIHPPRVGRDSSAPCYNKHGPLISIHPPRVGRDKIFGQGGQGFRISIHPPRVGRDAPFGDALAMDVNFNPPSPCGEGHSNSIGVELCSRFQSTLPVWGGTSGRWPWYLHRSISIHPPRVGRDIINPQLPPNIRISIHPPRVGRDDLNGTTPT